MPATIAEHMKTTAAADATADATTDTAVDTSAETSADTTADDSAETDATTTADATASADADEATEPEPKPTLFMSPDAQKLSKDKPKGPPQKPKMPDSVRSRIEAETRSRVEAEYQWAQGISKEEGQTLRQLRDMANSNPVQVIDRLVQSVARNPVHRAQLLSYLEQLYTPKSAQADADPMPEPDTPQGYSVAGVKALQEWSQRQILKQVQEQVAPLLSEREMAQRSQAAARYVDQQAARTVAQVSKRPGFQDNLDAIKKAYNEIPRPWKRADGTGDENHPDYRDEHALLLEAYYTVTEQKNLEKRQKQWAADQKKKAGIGVVNPGATQGGTTTQAKPKSFREYFKQNKDKFTK